MSRRDFTEEYLPVFHSLEAHVVEMYEARPDMTDYNVKSVYNALIKRYKSEQKGYDPRPARLRDMEEPLHADLLATLEWWLGREEEKPPETLTLQEVIKCLKVLEKSVAFWSKEKGRQGYLTYITPFLE